MQTAYIEGGTLTTSGGGVIKTVDTGSTLDGITSGILNNKGTLQVNDQTRLGLAGVINNTGLISENQTSNSGSTQIHIASQNVTLQGGGKLTMSNNSLNQIFGNAATDTLVNVDNTISGAGAIGGGANMFLVNQTKGVINANQSVALTVRTDGNIITNAGTMEGTSTGGLVLWNTAFNNAGGTIEALGAGAHVDLLSAYIEGGILTTATGGVIKTTDNGSSALDGITSGVVSNNGTIQIVDSTRLGLVGVINNTGTINAASSGGSTTLRIIGNTTLQGAGKVVMSDNVNNQIVGTSAGFQFANVDNTISGAGVIGGGANMIPGQPDQGRHQRQRVQRAHGADRREHHHQRGNDGGDLHCRVERWPGDLEHRREQRRRHDRGPWGVGARQPAKCRHPGRQTDHHRQGGDRDGGHQQHAGRHYVRGAH